MDDNNVRSPQSAQTYWLACGRYELTTGYTLRTTPQDDLSAFPAVHAAAKKYAKPLAERQLSAALVAGIGPVTVRLEEIVSLSGAAEDLRPAASAGHLVIASAANFVAARRRAIGRIAKGAKSRSLRHAFGIGSLLKANNLEDARDGCLALIAARGTHAGTAAARLITAGDVKKAKQFVAQLEQLRRESGARKSSTAETARERDVLHAALELFYDRFGAAVDLAFEDDDGARVALLSLIPRRKEQRGGAAAAPVPAPAAALTA